MRAHLAAMPLTAACTGGFTPPAGACGEETECAVGDGHYLVRMPSPAAGGTPVGAVMYFHGWRGSARAVMQNRALEQAVDMLGLALIAPHGAGRTWSYPGSPSAHRDEFAFVRSVLEDVTARLPVDASRIMATGFSMGGSMVWNLACHMGERFVGFAPIAGAFWEPLPERCPSAMPRLIHVHGLADRVVPYAGRELGSGARQGDVGRSIDLWMAQGGCPLRAPAAGSLEPREAPDDGALDCSRRFDCGRGSIELCLHDGGHRVRAEWVERAWRRLQQ